MSLTIDDPETVAAIRRLAEESQQSVEDVLRDAVETARARHLKVQERMARLKAIQEEYASWPKSGLKADKAFFDEIGGDL